jgi:hypothetical protein
MMSLTPQTGISKTPADLDFIARDAAMTIAGQRRREITDWDDSHRNRNALPHSRNSRHGPGSRQLQRY